MEEYSIGIIKPDAMDYRQEILSLIEKRGLKIIFQKEILLDKQSLTEIYKEIVRKDYFQPFVDFMMSGKCLAFIVKGCNAIRCLNELVGASDPSKAKPGTLRHRFGSDIRKNAIHSSKDAEHFKRELKILFPEFALEKTF